MLHVASVCTPCCMLLDVVAQSLKPVKLFSQQLPTFLLFRDRRSVAQHCWIRLHSSSNIVGATHAHYAWFTKTYGLYPSHDALQVPTLLGVVASVCTPLPTRTQQLPTLLAQQSWELLRPFARSLKHRHSEFKQRRFWATHVNRKWTFAFLGAVVAPRSNTKIEEASLPLDVRRAKMPYSGFSQF